MNTVMPLADQIRYGAETYGNYLQLCQYDEQPDWVRDIQQAINEGTDEPLQGKHYDEWVTGVYNQLTNNQNKQQSHETTLCKKVQCRYW